MQAFRKILPFLADAVEGAHLQVHAVLQLGEVLVDRVVYGMPSRDANTEIVVLER